MDLSNLKGILPIEVINQLQGLINSGPLTTQEVQAVASEVVQQEAPAVADEEIAAAEVQQAIKASDPVKLDPVGNTVELIPLKVEDVTHIVLPRNTHKNFSEKLVFDPTTDMDTGFIGPNTWGYLYTVSTGSLETDVALIGSLRPPMNHGGPVGYDCWKYMGPFFVNPDGNIEDLVQNGSRFDFMSSRIVEDLKQTNLISTANPVEVNLEENLYGLKLLPATAAIAHMQAILKATDSGQGFVNFYLKPYGHPKKNLESHSPSPNQITLDFPIRGTPKRIYRRVIEDRGQLDSYKLSLDGLTDGFIL